MSDIASSLAAITSPVLVLVGPTAIGKTSLSLDIAKRFNCEIVSVDSMQVYRYMDIGTAKPSLAERKGIKHHLIDIIDPDEQYDASAFRNDALKAISTIIELGKTPLLTGGTGLYLKALVEGLFDFAGTDCTDAREKLRSRVATEGKEQLFHELEQLDPTTAERIHKNDTQRLLRALEIYYTTGKTWSDHLAEQSAATVQFEHIFQACLKTDRQVLYDRIARRSDMMLQGGLIQEVVKLQEIGYSAKLSSMQSIGYRHANNYISGLWDMDETRRLLVRDTRRYAKRQMTWFGKNNSFRLFDREDHDTLYTSIDNWLKSTK